jgi:hypothetical protein
MKVATTSASDDQATFRCIHTTCNEVLTLLRATVHEEHALSVVKQVHMHSGLVEGGTMDCARTSYENEEPHRISERIQII